MAVYALAALSGVLYVLAFPGIGLWPLAFVALVPVLWLLDARPLRGRQALGAGLCFGAVTQLLGFRWLLPTLRAFSALPPVPCALIFVLICLLHAGQQALFVGLLWRAKRAGLSPLWLAPFCQAALELVYPQLFPNYFAASLHPVPLLAQHAELGGPILLSAWLVALNAALCSALRGRGARLPALATFAVLLGAAAGYGALRVHALQAVIERAPKLRVGIVQANMGTRQKLADRAEGRRRYLEQSRRLERAAQRPELLVWPETAVKYLLPEGTKNASQVLGPLTTPVLFGGLGHRVEHGKARLYNSAFLTDAAGHVLGREDKMHLIPFAEFIPLGDRIPRLYDLLPNSGEFTPGAGPRALPFRGRRIAALICYEDVLPGFVREVVRATQPNLLVNLSNDAWFGPSAEPPIHLALGALRAIEHRLYFVRASNSGISAFVDPMGRVIARTNLFVRANLVGEVAWLPGGTLYDSLGDWPGYLGLLVIGLALLRRSPRTSR